MSDDAPTSDRIFLGIVAGAVVGGLVLPLTLSTLFGSSFVTDLSVFALTWFLVSLSLLMLIPLIHMPLWWLSEAIGLKAQWSATIAGAFSLVAMVLVVGLLISGRVDWDGFDVREGAGPLAILAANGALIGYVIWRVSKWEAVPR